MSKSGGNAAIWVQLGNVRKEAGLHEEAMEAYVRAIRVDRTLADAHLQLGHLLKKMGANRRAARAYANALELDPDLADAQVELSAIDQDEESERLRSSADKARDSRDWHLAASLYQAYLYNGNNSNDAAIWTQLGHAQKEAGQREAAVRSYRRAIAIAPDVVDTYLHLGHLLKTTGVFSEAADCFAEALRLDPLLNEARHELEKLGGPTAVRGGSTIAHDDHLQSDPRNTINTSVVSARVTCSGSVDGLNNGFIRGWVVYEDNVTGRKCSGATVVVTCDGREIGKARVDDYRPDVARAIGCNPYCGFTFTPPARYRDGRTYVFSFYAAPQRNELRNSPITIEIPPIDASLDARRFYKDCSSAEFQAPDTGLPWPNGDFFAALYSAPDTNEVLDWVSSTRGLIQERYLLSQNEGRHHQHFASQRDLIKWYLSDETAWNLAPNSLFDVPYFRSRYRVPDDVHPLTGFYYLLSKGVSVSPSPFFDANLLEQQFVQRFGDDCTRSSQWYIQYLTDQEFWVMRPHWLFDGQFYLQENDDVERSDENPFLHFLFSGLLEMRTPHRAFDTMYYLEHNPDVRQSGQAAWTHYVTLGWKEGRQPNKFFHEEEYCAVAGISGEPGLRHYLEHPVDGTRLLLRSSQALRSFLLNHYEAIDPAASPLEQLAQFLQPPFDGAKLGPEETNLNEMRAISARLNQSEHLNARRRRRLIIFGETTIGQCTLYRIIEKARMFERYSDWMVGCYNWQHPRETIQALQFANLLIIYRVPETPETRVVVGEARRLGVPVIYEIDDLVFDVSAYRNVLLATGKTSFGIHTRESLLRGARRYRDLLLHCDCAIGSTDKIVQSLKRISGRPAYRVQNALTTDQLEIKLLPPLFPKEHVRIFFGSGTSTHDEDFREIEEPLLFVIENNPGTKLDIIGSLHPSQRFMSRARLLSGRINFMPIMDYEAYIQFISQADIAIAPLEANSLNDAKSNIKFLEAALLKIPIIASDRQAFTSIIQNGVNGFCVATAAEWQEALSILVTQPETRRRLGLAAYVSALQHYHPKQIFENEMLPCISEVYGVQSRHETPDIRLVVVRKFLEHSEYFIRNLRSYSRPGEKIVFASTVRNAGFVSPGSWWRYSVEGHSAFLLADTGDGIPADVAAQRVQELLSEIEPTSLTVIDNDRLAIAAIEAAGPLPIEALISDAGWLCDRRNMIMADGQSCRQGILDPGTCTACMGGAFNFYEVNTRKRKALAKATRLIFDDAHIIDLYRQNIPSLPFSVVQPGDTGRKRQQLSEQVRQGRVCVAFVEGDYRRFYEISRDFCLNWRVSCLFLSEESRDAAIKDYELHNVAEQIVVITTTDQIPGILETVELLILSSDGFLITNRLQREAAALGVHVVYTADTKSQNPLLYKRLFQSTKTERVEF
jgi:tetratricopeptide (TPR) repeat protein/glycosyltransferase involved in cell wall biosynthesis